MASVPRLVLCEEKIREKSGLAPHRDLAELQSLSVPGTYQEKITHLGTSLMKLRGLRSLDLSRNSLVSLEGIQYLTALESLNLYYNSISSLSEVFRLHCLTELQDVDFRLNPVVKSESDYRLFVVHMLPRLQQLAQARHILSSVPELTVAQDTSAGVSEEVNFLTLENKSLQNHLADQQQQHAQKMSEVMSELHEARQEMGDLRQHLDKSLEENSSLKSLLFSMKQEMESAEASAVLNSQITGLQTSVKRLSEEVVELKQHLERYDQIQELTRMLQESHSSLVSTNEHLLQELSQARAQHKAEVEQMHWSYQELKKTMALFPQCSASPSGRQSC